MLVALCILCTITVTSGFGFPNAGFQSAVVHRTVDGFHYIVEGVRYDMDALATGAYQDTTESLGWATLQIEGTNDGYTPEEKMYAMGFLEGYFTHERTFKYYKNFKHNKYQNKIPTNLTTWVRDQWDWVREQAGLYKSVDEYWAVMAGFTAQVEGFAAAIKQFAPADEQMTTFEVYFLQASGDLTELDAAFMPHKKPAKAHNRPSESHLRAHYPHIHDAGDGVLATLECSALIKLLPDGTAAVMHNTWRGYSAMQRIYKKYTYPNGQTVAMSSSPGFVHSKDDFYIQENGGKLVVIETTNGVYNRELIDWLATSPSARTVALSWQRAMLANILAKDAKEWIDLVMLHNSGTYNNQWMALDTRKLHSGTKADVLWIGEQSIQYYEKADVSDVLFEKGFWKSYNIPYFPRVYELMGYNSSDPQSNYEECARSRIFERDAPNLETLDDVLQFGRYNDYEHDPLSLDCSRLSIASRYDLTVESTCGRGAHPSAFGAIDAKVVKSDRFDDVRAISGPTTGKNGELGAFEWKTSGLDESVSHDGTPARFDFPWVAYTPQVFDVVPGAKEEDTSQRGMANMKPGSRPVEDLLAAGVGPIVE